VLESLVIDIDDMPVVCADDEKFELSYRVSSGNLTGYSIIYSELAKSAGFEDVEVDSMESIESIELILPEEVRPNRYEVNLIFYNSDCGNVDTTFVFDVLYPDSVIAQRWNDVLAVKNAKNNGGYEFTSYKWYFNGQPLDGFVTSQYYTGLDLDFTGEYQVLLTRKNDGVSMLTCGLVPTKFAESDLTEAGTLVFANSVVEVESPQASKCYIYSMSGLIYALYDLKEGVNYIQMPAVAGIYLVVIDGDVRKMVVRN
jgi:hypothetical protein